MAKNLIIQTVINPKNHHLIDGKVGTMFTYSPNIYAVAKEKAQEYANKIGVDYHCIDTYEYDEHLSPAWQRLAIFTNRNKDLIDYDQYDNIVYFDGDYVIIPEIAPNIFELMEKDGGKFFAAPERNPSDPLPSVTKMKLRQGWPETFDYFNSGCIGLTRECIDAFKEKLDWAISTASHTMADQNPLNQLVAHTYPNYTRISRNWNWVLNNTQPLFGIHYCSFSKNVFSVDKHNKHVKKKLERVSRLNINVNETFHQLFSEMYYSDPVLGEKTTATLKRNAEKRLQRSLQQQQQKKLSNGL